MTTVRPEDPLPFVVPTEQHETFNGVLPGMAYPGGEDWERANNEKDKRLFELTVAHDRVYPYTLPPVVSPVLLSKAEFIERVPVMAEKLAGLTTSMTKHGFEVAGCVLDDGVLPADLMATGGKVLMGMLPAQYEKHLEALVTQKFESMNIFSPDYAGQLAVDCSSVQLDDEFITTFAWNSMYSSDVAREESAGGPRFWRTRLVLCAGNSVALGGFWQTENDMLAAQVTGICAQSYVQLLEELNELVERTAASDSPMPRYGTVLDAGDGEKFALIPMLAPVADTSDSNDDDDTVVTEPQSKPSVPVPALKFSNLDEYCEPEPTQHVRWNYRVVSYQVDDLPEGGDRILRLCATLRTGDEAHRWREPKVAMTWNYMTGLPCFDGSERYPMLVVHLPVEMFPDLEPLAKGSIEVRKVKYWEDASTVISLSGQRNVLELWASDVFPLLRLSDLRHVLVAFVCADQVRCVKYDFDRKDFLKVCGHLLEEEALFEARQNSKVTDVPECDAKVTDEREHWQPLICNCDDDYRFHL